MKPVLVIGVGNQFRMDDAVGLLVARRIYDLKIPFVTVREESGEGVSLMSAWQEYDRVFLIDAVQNENEPGKIYRFDAHKEKLPGRFFNYSTHAFSVAEAVEMSRALGSLPENIIIYGIEGMNFGIGQSLSEAVEKAKCEVVDALVDELSALESIHA